MKVYLDNAATTQIDPEVVGAMLPVISEQYGNPSSIHSFGRATRSLIEQSRKTVAKLLNASPSEIFFTSGGTEANNTAIRCGIRDLGLTHAISSAIEHHAVTHTLEELDHNKIVKLSLVNLDARGHVDLNHLEELLKSNPKSFVSLMHANNEIGTVTPIEKVGELCRKYGAVYHSDTVQTMGHLPHNLSSIPVDFVSCAAHKFHGPKGVGFLYINSKIKIHPFITGGAQERNMRGGTENVYGIVGLAKALEIAYRDMEKDMTKIKELKKYMAETVTKEIPGVSFNGDISEGNLDTVLNISFPASENAEMLLFNLDIAGIAASGGSACSSGSDAGSHVLKALNADPSRPAVRFSFSKYTSREEIDFCISKLKEFCLEKV
ncbi:MAG TPA: cysteine desulfurase family protein [Bacteroidia bacterium]|nr:cysteine desulfurase family protein [Bacteroidia bacterium]